MLDCLPTSTLTFLISLWMVDNDMVGKCYAQDSKCCGLFGWTFYLRIRGFWPKKPACLIQEWRRLWSHEEISKMTSPWDCAASFSSSIRDGMYHYWVLPEPQAVSKGKRMKDRQYSTPSRKESSVCIRISNTSHILGRILSSEETTLWSMLVSMEILYMTWIAAVLSRGLLGGSRRDHVRATIPCVSVFKQVRLHTLLAIDWKAAISLSLAGALVCFWIFSSNIWLDGPSPWRAKCTSNASISFRTMTSLDYSPHQQLG